MDYFTESFTLLRSYIKNNMIANETCESETVLQLLTKYNKGRTLGQNSH